MDWSRVNAEVIAEFRANGGRVARFGDLPVAILHTRPDGRPEPRLVPLVVVVEGDDHLLFATAAGAPKDPAWVGHLRDAPDIEVEMGTERFDARIEELAFDAAEAKCNEMAGRVQQFADYQASAAPRRIPVFRMVRSA